MVASSSSVLRDDRELLSVLRQTGEPSKRNAMDSLNIDSPDAPREPTKADRGALTDALIEGERSGISERKVPDILAAVRKETSDRA